MSKNGLKKEVGGKTVLVTVLVFVFAIVAAVMLFFRANNTSGITEDQIKIERGEKTVIVNESGVVEYRTARGIYYDYWDSDTTKNFFSYVRQIAREYLDSGSKPLGDGYFITLYLDGREVQIWVSSDDEVISEVFNVDSEDVDNGGTDDSLGNYFEDFFNPSPTPLSGTNPTATPAVSGPGVVSAQSGGTTPSGSGNPPPPVDCSLYDAQVTGRTIISNTLCVGE